MNNLYVIKCGGSFAMQKHSIMAFLEVVKKLVEKNNFVVIVHGGGPQADDLAHKLQIPVKKINGKRITDFQTLQITKMAYAGLVNTDLVSFCVSQDIQAVGISGVSGKLIEVVKRPKVQVKNTVTGDMELVDFGYVGDIKKVNKKMLQMIFKNGYIPIISCLGVDGSGQVFNVNADRLAANIAMSFKAKKLIFISDVQGIAEDKNKVNILRNLSFAKANELISNGVINGGMIPKIENSYIALGKDVENVQILGPLKTKKDWQDAILYEKFGTVITQGGAYE